MIEDALKAVRTFHRMIIGVSLITMVFALSIDLPEEKVSQIEALQSLKRFPFLDYESYVTERIEHFYPALVEPGAKKVDDAVNTLGALTFGLDRLGSVFRKPAHIGRIQSKDLVFANIQDASLSQLDAISVALDIAKPVQVWISQIDEVLPKIEAFISEQSILAGGRIDNVRLGADVDVTGQSFLPGSEFYASLYFELVPAGQSGGTPIFTTEFPTNLHEIPDSDWKSWLLAQPGIQKIVSERDGELVWLPEIDNRPYGFEQKKIGLLISDLTRELNESSPESQKISLLGTEIPGILVVFASPLILLTLAYYFFNHLSHLLKLVGTDTKAFREFAWMPLSLDEHWVWETYATIIVLPTVSVLFLNLRLSVFQTSRLLPILVAAVSIFLVVFLGLRSVKRLRLIRAQLG